MRRQTEVIIGSKVDDVLAVEGALRRLLVAEDAQLEVGALFLELVELLAEISKLRAGGLDRHFRSSARILRVHFFSPQRTRSAHRNCKSKTWVAQVPRLGTSL